VFFRACPVSRQLGSLAACANKFPVLFCVEFPGRREKCREFLRFSRSLRKSVSKTSANSEICRRIPYADEQGIISREQGIKSGFWTGAGNSAQKRPLAPTYPIASKGSTRRTTVAMHNGDLSLRDVRDILEQAKPSHKAFFEAALKCPVTASPPHPTKLSQPTEIRS